MFTCAKIRDGSTYLGHHLTANDYYAEGESVTGRWVGKGADRLGLTGGAIKTGNLPFEGFRQNRLPTGDKLTPRDSRDRVRFFDLQCSAQKSVSVMAITLGDYRLVEAHRDAVSFAFKELEIFAACQNNTREERRNRITGEMISARFEHTASRALDAQLHTHLVTVNATYDAVENRWKALTEEEMFKAIRYAGKVYQNELAKHCRELGYEIRESTDAKGRITGFEIAGVPQSILTRFSKRREQIEKEIGRFKAKFGRDPTSAEIHVITTATRDKKLKETTTPAVVLAQRAQLTPDELRLLETLKTEALNKSSPDLAETPLIESHAIRRACAQLFERECVAKGHDLLAEALNQSLGSLNLTRLKQSLAAKHLPRLTGQDPHSLRDLFTTENELRRERWIRSVARAEQGELPELAPQPTGCENLSPEQSRAVRHLIACRDRLALLRGAAGVGKTTALHGLNRSLTATGHQPVYVTPTSAAAQMLREEGFPQACTVAALLNSSAPAALRSGVLICDEAGMLSNQDGQALLRLAMKQDWRVIFIGDARQHTAVDAGDFFRLLESTEGIHLAELTAIRRQHAADYKSAITQMAAGLPREGLRQLNDIGFVHESGAEYISHAARDYLDSTKAGASPAEAICVAPTWEEIDALNDAIRRQLKTEGHLQTGMTVTTHQPLGWTTAEKSDPTKYREGMTIIFNRNCGAFRAGDITTVTESNRTRVQVRRADGKVRALPLNKGAHEVCQAKHHDLAEGDPILIRANDRQRQLVNGTRLHVTRIDKENERITTAEGITFSPREFSRFTYGYATTSHKSQGLTCERVIIAAAHLDAKSAYVACSRGRISCALHTPDFAKLRASLPSGDRALALESDANRNLEESHQSSPTSCPLMNHPAWAGLSAHMPQPPAVLFDSPRHEHPAAPPTV